MIKVLGFALYGSLAASTRVRLEQYAPGLQQHGIDLQVTSLLGNDYVSGRFNGTRLPWGSLLKGGWDRLRWLQRARQFDLAIVYCELFPLLPGTFERRLIGIPYIYDFDDAFYLRYRIGGKRVLQGVLGHKFDQVMGGAAAVTAGNQVLADYASQHNPRAYLLPTVVDVSRYLALRREPSGKFIVGWIGSPSTSTYLPELIEPLRQLGREGEVEFVVVGGKAPPIPGVHITEIPWSEDSEVNVINTFDVGLMPLPDDAWARGKCAYKLIQYMACGLPVVGSPVGANKDVVTPECGFMASSATEWATALRRLRDDPHLRAQMGRAGRERVVARYSLQTNVPQLASIIKNVARGQGRCAELREH